MTTTKSIHRADARKMLKHKGWSFRKAAPVLGVHYTHLFRVISGERTSQALLQRIAHLPNRRESAR